MIDYAENLCEAMKIIFDKEIKQFAFDITIDATVEDASKAENGIYTVSHDGATFIAYSTDTSFKEKDVVMVTVPQGNYDNQKMIIGKQVDKDKEEKPITYQSPFSQITNLSGNLVYGNIGEKGLLANGGIFIRNINSSQPEEELKPLIEDAQKKVIYSLGEGEQVPLSEEYQSNGYTRIGLRADFSTWLNEFNVISGNYGLILTLKFKNPDAMNTNESTITAIYTFDSSEFFGDIYNFETYYNQEAIFDISDYSNYPIQSIKLEAYQKDNFKVSDGSYLSYESEIFDNSFKPSDNIFIKDPFICLGTAVGEFKKDTANIMTTSASIYNNSNNFNDDIKNLKLKWTHQDLNSKDIYVVQEDEIPTNYEIRWYKFKLGASSPDRFMDAHWVRFYGCKSKADKYGDYYLTQEEINNNEALDIATNKINVNFQPNRNNQTEQIRVVILKKDENNNELFVAQTPIITFNNNEQVPVDVNYIDANALGIQFKDSEKGKYYYYDKTGKIFYGEKSKEERILQAVFSSYTNLENKQELKTLDKQTYTSIKWIFPKDFTMIIPILPDGKTINELKKELGLQKFDGKITYNKDTENNIYYGYRIEENDSTYEIFFDSSIPDMYNSDAIESALIQMKYKIDENFSFNKSRNAVYLETEINGQRYVSSATMFFGMAGTSGSDYTIVVEWNMGIPVFDIGKDDFSLKGDVKLLDQYQEEVILNNDAIYEYNLKCNNNDDDNNILKCLIDSEQKDNHNSHFIIEPINNNRSISINDLYLLEIKLTNFGDYDLITNYPIALKNTIKENNQEKIVVNGITGTTTIRYASDGTITKDDKNSYSISFQIWNNNKFESVNSKQVGYWKIISDSNTNDFFLPKLIETENDIENFILKLNKVHYPDSNSETTLLDVLLYIIPEENENETVNERFTSFIDKIDSISLNIFPPLEGNNEKETIDNFKNFLLKIDSGKLKSLFTTLKDKFSEDYSFNDSLLSKIINPILSPPSIYFKNDTPLYGVQYIYSPDGISNQPLYTQPIYVYQDNYPSTTINQWNGRDLILDENKGTIVANGFSAGRKEDNNTFTGVMVGDWSRTDSDSSISSTTGIYGFHQGAMSYAFTDDGKAFIGKDGVGRIEFDGNNGIIKSANFTSPSENSFGLGTLIDLKAGSIELYSPVNNSQTDIHYSLKLSSIGDEITNQPFLQIGRSIDQIKIISSTYLNNYLTALNDLKEYLSEYYIKLKDISQACIKLSNYYYNDPKNEFNKELWTYNYHEQNSNSIIASGEGKYINPDGDKDDFTLLLEKKVTTNLIGTFYNNIINNHLYNYNTSNDYNAPLGHDFSYSNFPDLLASEYPSGKNNNEERVSAPWSIRKLFFKDTNSATYGQDYWEFLSLTALGKETLINYEIEYLKSEHLKLLKKYYKTPSYNNLKIANKFIMKYIKEFSISDISEIRSINNYYLESQQGLIEIENDNEEYDGKEETQNLQLIKILFNENKKSFIAPNGKNYYLAGFIKNDNSIGYQEITDKEAIEAYFNAEKTNQWEKNGNNETIYYLDNNNHYQTPNNYQDYKSNPFLYHKINDEYIKAGDFWFDNTYRRNAVDNGYTQENDSNNVHTYYIKKVDEDVYYPIIDYCIEWIEYEDLHNTTNQEIKEVQITSQLDNDENLDEDIYIKINNNTFEKINNMTYKTRNIYWHNIAKENEDPYYIKANEFWENNTYNNNYELINEQNFQIYYIKKDSIYYQIRHYYNTNNFNTNQYNSKEEALEHLQTPNPMLYFEDDKIYYIKKENEYFQTSNCDNNNSYAIALTCMRPLSSIIRENKDYIFDSTLNYFKYIQQTYDNRANQNFIFESTENKNEYIFKSLIIKNSDNQTEQITIPLLIGNGENAVFSKGITINLNTPVDILLQIDPETAPTSDWKSYTFQTNSTYIDENGEEAIEMDTNGYPVKISHTSYVKINNSKISFGIFTFNLNLQNKYNSLNSSVFTTRRYTTSSYSTLSNYKILTRVQDIVNKIKQVNNETNNLLTYIPAINQKDYYDLIKQSYYYGPDAKNTTSKQYITLKKIKENTENENFINSICKNMENSINNDTFIFDKIDWENDLIKIVKNGGYITSKDYRPTMISGDKTIRLPTQNQDDSSSNWRQGMKGFIIDLSNNRIVLGNNSQIEGVQTQYYPGQTDISHRYFYISTGVKFKKDKTLGRDRLETETNGYDKSYFIRAKAGSFASTSSLQDRFFVRWDGYVFCESLRVHSNFYFGSDFNKVQFDKIAGVYDPQGSGNKILYFCDKNGNLLSNIHVLCY